MYYFSAILISAIFILTILVFFSIWYMHRKKIINKVICISMQQKCEIINNILKPFGYAYVQSKDIFTSRIDAWQRQFGYGAFYDKAASHFGMILNSLPVYFNYDNRTWLIEFWKGQYGINTGCEIGIYYADRILNEDELDHTLFKSVSNEDMPELSLTFYNFTSQKDIAQLNSRHWWLTAFKPGMFSIPSNLCVLSSITLTTPDMASAFAKALVGLGYSTYDIDIYKSTVTFTFEGATLDCGTFNRIRISIAQLFNKMWCRVYLFVTRPFILSIDRVLYLYYYLPFVLRRMLNIRKFKGYKK